MRRVQFNFHTAFAVSLVGPALRRDDERFGGGDLGRMSSAGQALNTKLVTPTQVGARESCNVIGVENKKPTAPHASEQRNSTCG